MSGFAASWKCFYCSNPINADGEFVYSTIEHRYVDGNTRESDRRFHSPCFEKFEAHGHPYNPRTDPWLRPASSRALSSASSDRSRPSTTRTTAKTSMTVATSAGSR